MATRNPANEIEFGAVNFGPTISVFAVEGATDCGTQVAPGQKMEAVVEAAAQKGTIIGLGSVTGISSDAFNIYMEGSSWTASDLETAVAAIFSGATVTDAGL